jgi:hypothetical protein
MTVCNSLRKFRRQKPRVCIRVVRMAWNPLEFAMHFVAYASSAGAGAILTNLYHAFNLGGRLSGRWIGDLECQSKGDPKYSSHVIHCMLVVARPIGGRSSGLLYYDRQCHATNMIITRGVDELKDYSRLNNAFSTPQFTMDFVRRFHYEAVGTNQSPRPYHFRCSFPRIFSRSTLRIQTQIESTTTGLDIWTGLFRKE